MTPSAALFDVDGTLIDSNDLHAEAWAVAFRRFGFDIPVDRVRTQIGKGGDHLVPDLLPADFVAREGEALKKWRGALFKRDYLPRARPFAGVCDLFRRLRAQGTRIALATSSKEDELAHHLDRLGCRALVDAAVTADDVASSKPDPDIFAAAAAKLGVGPGRAIAVGDTPYDVVAAARAGIRTIALRSGGFPEAELQATGPIAIYDDVAALLSGFDGSPLGAR